MEEAQASGADEQESLTEVVRFLVEETRAGLD